MSRNVTEDLKAQFFPLGTLARFDRAIAELDKFEDIRYPDQGIPPAAPSSRPPRYTLVVDDLDALVQAIFQKANVNPRFFFNSLNQAARTYLDQYQAIRW